MERHITYTTREQRESMHQRVTLPDRDVADLICKPEKDVAPIQPIHDHWRVGSAHLVESPTNKHLVGRVIEPSETTIKYRIAWPGEFLPEDTLNRTVRRERFCICQIFVLMPYEANSILECVPQVITLITISKDLKLYSIPDGFRALIRRRLPQTKKKMTLEASFLRRLQNNHLKNSGLFTQSLTNNDNNNMPNRQPSSSSSSDDELVDRMITSDPNIFSSSDEGEGEEVPAEEEEEPVPDIFTDSDSEVSSTEAPAADDDDDDVQEISQPTPPPPTPPAAAPAKKPKTTTTTAVAKPTPSKTKKTAPKPGVKISAKPNVKKTKRAANTTPAIKPATPARGPTKRAEPDSAAAKKTQKKQKKVASVEAPVEAEPPKRLNDGMKKKLIRKAASTAWADMARHYADMSDDERTEALDGQVNEICANPETFKRHMRNFFAYTLSLEQTADLKKWITTPSFIVQKATSETYTPQAMLEDPGFMDYLRVAFHGLPDEFNIPTPEYAASFGTVMGQNGNAK